LITRYSARRGSISKMAPSGVASGEILGHTRHKSACINTVYQSRKTYTKGHRHNCFMIGTSSTGNNPTSYVQQVQPPSYHFPGVQYSQYLFPMVQYQAPVTCHNQSICTNYGSVSGINPTYLAPKSCGSMNFKD
jgi:hypothetical protein